MRPVYLLLIAAISFGCSTSKDYIIDSDYSYRGHFKKYKTYNFIEDANGAEDNARGIRKLISNRMGYQGYRLTDRKPDLLISHKIFFSDFQFNGYSQPTFESWLNIKPERIVKVESDSIIDKQNKEFVYRSEEKYNQRDVPMREGTILITFFDRRQDMVIWQGYASGIFSDNSDQDKNLKIAVSKIYDQYRILAEDFGNAN